MLASGSPGRKDLPECLLLLCTHTNKGGLDRLSASHCLRFRGFVDPLIPRARRDQLARTWPHFGSTELDRLVRKKLGAKSGRRIWRDPALGVASSRMGNRTQTLVKLVKSILATRLRPLNCS